MKSIRISQLRHIFAAVVGSPAAALPVCVFLAIIFSGCGDSPIIKTSASVGATPALPRQQIKYFRGITEPRGQDWQDLADDANHVRGDGINTVMIDPPVLVSQRAGGKSRVAIQGTVETAPVVIDNLHQSGLSVHLAPTSAIPGFSPQIEITDANLGHLNDDTLRWAAIAEERQAELFSPLSRYNLALGTEAADKWSAAILPRIREKYKGPLAAMVVPDLGPTPPAGSTHDFERLNYKGYDYLMIDIFPRDVPFDQAKFEGQVSDILARATAVMQRDGLKGILIRCGSWREQSGLDPLDGPELGEDGQAKLTGRILEMTSPQVMPQVNGFFFEGWTLPGRGARDFAVEPVLKDAYVRESKTGP